MYRHYPRKAVYLAINHVYCVLIQQLMIYTVLKYVKLKVRLPIDISMFIRQYF